MVAGANTLSLLQSRSPWCSTLVLDPALLVGCPPVTVSCLYERGRKLLLTRVQLFTRAEEMEGCKRHNWVLWDVPAVADSWGNLPF